MRKISNRSKIVIAAVVFMIVFVGLATFFSTRQKTVDEPPAETPETTVSQTEDVIDENTPTKESVEYANVEMNDFADSEAGQLTEQYSGVAGNAVVEFLNQSLIESATARKTRLQAVFATDSPVPNYTASNVNASSQPVIMSSAASISNDGVIFNDYDGTNLSFLVFASVSLTNSGGDAANRVKYQDQGWEIVFTRSDSDWVPYDIKRYN